MRPPQEKEREFQELTQIDPSQLKAMAAAEAQRPKPAPGSTELLEWMNERRVDVVKGPRRRKLVWTCDGLADQE